MFSVETTKSAVSKPLEIRQGVHRVVVPISRFGFTFRLVGFDNFFYYDLILDI